MLPETAPTLLSNHSDCLAFALDSYILDLSDYVH